MAPDSSDTGRPRGCRDYGGPPAVHGLGSWPMVRPHCNSSSVRSHSHRVPVKKAVVQPAQGEVDDHGHVGVVAAQKILSMFSFGNG